MIEWVGECADGAGAVRFVDKVRVLECLQCFGKQCAPIAAGTMVLFLARDRRCEHKHANAQHKGDDPTHCATAAPMMDASATGQPPERSRLKAAASLGDADNVKEGASILQQCLQ